MLYATKDRRPDQRAYYLRARYYAPTIGRFTQQDTHWASANAIYGDNPRKINERQDALGLTTYAYAPEITAIMQSGNLYVYCVNSPMVYRDSTGNAIAKSYDSGDNELAILIVAIVAISAGEIVYFAKQNHAKGSSGKIGGGTAVAGAPMPDPDDDDKNKKQGYLSKQELNRRKSQVLENKDIHFKTKEQALEFIEKKFPGFKQEIAKHRSSQGWHFDLHPINNSANPIEHINLYSKSGGFSIHITWG